MSLATGAYKLLVNKVSSVTGIPNSSILRVSTLNELTIEERIRRGNVTTPFILLFMGEDIEWEEGLNTRCSVTPVDIGYVVRLDTVDNLDILETVCESLVHQLYGFQQIVGTDAIQILEMPIKNVDTSNAFNDILMELQTGLVSGAVSCKVLHGDII